MAGCRSKTLIQVIILIITLLGYFLTTGCSNKEEMTGKTKKGDLTSPCVSKENGTCSLRINPNFIVIQSSEEKKIIS